MVTDSRNRPVDHVAYIKCPEKLLQGISVYAVLPEYIFTI